MEEKKKKDSNNKIKLCSSGALSCYLLSSVSGNEGEGVKVEVEVEVEVGGYSVSG